MIQTAYFSECRNYRYTLWRIWDETKPFCLFIGLNPSTADETNDDPTIRRCINFAQTWGYGALCMANLFAFRATNPKNMMNNIKPIGKLNDEYLIMLSQLADVTIAAWGNNGSYLSRDKEVIKIISEMKCLRKTKKGFPGHPLYIPSDTKLKLFVE